MNSSDTRVSEALSSQGTAAGLQRSIHYRQLITMGVGTIVGVAWLMVLGSVISGGGPIGAVIAFVVGACAMIPIGLCYGEIAGLLPFAGGEVIYTFDVFGARMAYIAGLCLTFSYLINCIFFAVSVGWLADKLLPGIQGPPLYSILHNSVHAGDLLIGLVTALAIGLTNFRGAHVAAKLQDFATYALMLGALLFVVAGIIGGSTRNLHPAIVSGGWAWGAGGILSVIAVTPYFFGGFNTIPQTLSELKFKPGKTHVAGAMSLSILISLLFLCAVLISVSMTMPRQRLLSFDLPVAQAFAVAFHSRVLADVVLLSGLIGLVAVWNALFFALTRALFALGRSRLLSPRLGAVHATSGAPAASVLFATFLTMAGTFLGKGVLLPVVDVTSTLFAFLYVLVTLATHKSRKTKPDAVRPYRVPGHLLIFFAIAYSIYLVCLSLYQQFISSPSPIPVAWEILAAFCLGGFALWHFLKPVRSSISDEERRRAIM